MTLVIDTKHFFAGDACLLGYDLGEGRGVLSVYVRRNKSDVRV